MRRPLGRLRDRLGNGAVARLMARYLSVALTGCAREALSSLDALFAAVSG